MELLVVTGVIALLAALIWPALGRARERARKTLCTGNLRQIGQAALMYHDQCGRLPTSAFSGYILWNGTDYVLYGRMVPVTGKALGRAFYCPSSRTFKTGSSTTGLANLGQPGKLTAGTYDCRSESQGAPARLTASTQAVLADLFEAGAGLVNHADGSNVLSTDGSVRFWQFPVTASLNDAALWSQLDSGNVVSGY